MNHTHEQGGAGAPQASMAPQRDAEDASSHHDVHRRRDRRQPVRRLGQHRALGGAGGGAGLSGRRHRGGVHHACWAEMATANPDTGSFSTYADRAIGRWAGFTIGWLYWGYWALLMAWGARRGHHPARVVPDAVGQRVHAGRHAGADPAELLQRQELRRGRVLVRADQVVAIVCFIVVGTLAVLRPWGGSPGVANLVAHGGFMRRQGGGGGAAGVMFAFLGVDRHHRRVRVSQSGAADQPRHALGGVAGLPVLHRLDLPDRRAGAVE